MLKCIGCEKTPEELHEYIIESSVGKLTPSQWVRENEAVGVWGSQHGPNAFYCTSCYIKAGMPLRK